MHRHLAFSICSLITLATVIAEVNVCLKLFVVGNTAYLHCKIERFKFNIEFIYPNGTLYGSCYAPVGSELESKQPIDCKHNITLHVENSTVILRIENPMLGVWTCKHGSGYPNDTVDVTSSLFGQNVQQECTENGKDMMTWISVYAVTVLCIFVVSNCEKVRSLVDIFKGKIRVLLKTKWPRRQHDVENPSRLAGISSEKACKTCRQSVTALCVDCKAYFCGTCFNTHQINKNNHHVCTFSFKAEGTFDVKCENCGHTQSDFVCFTHGALLCLDCKCKNTTNMDCERIKISRPIVTDKTKRSSSSFNEVKLLHTIHFSIFSKENDTESLRRRICGLCCLPDTCLLLADTNMKELLWYQNFKSVDKLSLGAEPKGIVHLTGWSFAVSFPERKQIVIYEFKDKQYIKKPDVIREIDFGRYGKPFSIAYNSGHFAAEINEGDSGYIGIFDNEGKSCHHKLRVHAYFTGNTIRLAMDYIGEKLFVSALGVKKLICTDLSGQKLWNRDISSPRGVLCLPGNKTVLLATKHHDTVYKVNADNGDCDVLSEETSKINKPRYISYDEDKKLLYLHVDEGQILVYSYQGGKDKLAKY